MRTPVVLVTMPWALLEFPSIALGTLGSVLRGAGIEPVIRSYNLSFLEFVNQTLPAGSEPVTIDEYREIANVSPGRGLGDWIFAVPPFREHSPEEDACYLELLRSERSMKEHLLARARQLRAQVPAFIEACVEELLRYEPAMVGFTTTFNQNVSSLLLSKRLKERAPHVKVVFGGANCDGPMGRALFEAFPWLDVVVQGEAEGLIVPLTKDIVAGGPVTPRGGLLVRGVEGLQGGEAPRPLMDEVPPPDYDFYFEELKKVSFREDLLTSVWLPVETARGCWWGQKQHCTFCGLNGSTMAFRSKSVERALRDFDTLATRYKWLDFTAVDNIIDLEYLKELLPRLKERGLDLRIFYETKANLTKEQVRNMRAAGIFRIQPGIESLSTPILKLMRKGVAAWQNVRLLKWCAQYDVLVAWNILYGFPQEPVEEYERMQAFLPALTHLPPPNLARLQMQRFSPYHQKPETFGLKMEGPHYHYRYVYPLEGRLLEDVAYNFESSYLDGRNPDDYMGPLRLAVARWRHLYENNRGQLTYRRGPGFVRIVDNRQPYGYTSYVLEGEQAVAYLACDAGATAQMAHQALEKAGFTSVSVQEVEGFLRELVEARLMFESDKRFVSLALPMNAAQDEAQAAVLPQVAEPPRAKASNG